MDILQRRPDLFQGPIFKKIASIADVALLSKEERIQYDVYLRQYQEGMADGIEKGMEKGMAEGEANEKLRIAMMMKTSGVPLEQIAQWTGLTTKVIMDLKEKAANSD